MTNGLMTEWSVDVTIKELRILPPFAIGRLGSGAPIDSYLIKVDDTAPLDWRTIVPTTTFVIDPSTRRRGPPNPFDLRIPCMMGIRFSRLPPEKSKRMYPRSVRLRRK
jgi:hypothetical protein